MPPRTRPRPWTVAQVAAVPAGVQPEHAGHLVCLICGHLYRKMSMHLARRHGLTCADYRDQFDLPRGLGLLACDLREQQAAYARAQYPANTALHNAHTHQQRRDLIRQAVAARAASAGRAGVQAAQRENPQRRSAAIRAATRAGYDQRARGLGFADIADLLERTDEHTDLDLARMLGVAESTAGRIRHLYHQPAHTGGARRGQQYSRHHHRRWTASAQAAGYADLYDCLDNTRHLPAKRLAALLQASPPTIAKLRRETRP